MEDVSQRSETTVGSLELAIGSSAHPVLSRNHIILAEDVDYTDDNGNVDGKYGRINGPLVPVAMSVAINDVSGVSYSYNQETDLRVISLSGLSGEELIIGHMIHDSNTTQGDVRQFASISNRPANLTISQQEQISHISQQGDRYYHIQWWGDGTQCTKIERSALRIPITTWGNIVIHRA